MGGFICWAIALGVLAVGTLAALYVLRVGAALAIKRDREQHLRIVNEARRRAGKPPMTDADLPPEPAPERDELLEKFFGWMRGNNRGFAVEPAREEEERPKVVEKAAERSAVKSAEKSADKQRVRKVEQAKPVLPVLPVGEGEAGGQGEQKGDDRPTVVLLESTWRAVSEEKLRTCVEKAWGVDIGTDRTATEWVVYPVESGPGLISCGGVMLMFQNLPGSYFGDPKKTAKDVREKRMQDAILRSTAHRSVTIMSGAEGIDREGAYALLCKLGAELAGNTTLGVCLPVEGRFFPYDETVLRAMMGENPLASLREAQIAWVPLMEEDDREMLEAIAQAKARFGEFEEAFASRAITGSGKKSPYLVKAGFTEGENTEHMWVEVTAIEGGRVVGFLRSSPVSLKGLVKDEAVTVRVADVSDWIGMMNGEPIGNFTGPVIEKQHGGRQA